MTKTATAETRLSSLHLWRSYCCVQNLSNWVQIMVLSKTSPKERAVIVTKFVNVGKVSRWACSMKNVLRTSSSFSIYGNCVTSTP